MATFGGRSYTNGDRNERGGGPEQGATRGADVQREERGGFPARGGEDRSRDRGGYQGGGGGYDRDPNFAFISYLYATGKKGGYSVFLKRDMIEILKSLEDDDVLGITPSGQHGGWMMYARRIDPQQKEDYKRRGGGERGGGGGYRR